MPGARDPDFLYPNILCLEHHVPIPYDSFTNPKLQDLSGPTEGFFFPYGPFCFLQENRKKRSWSIGLVKES